MRITHYALYLCDVSLSISTNRIAVKKQGTSFFIAMHYALPFRGLHSANNKTKIRDVEKTLGGA